MIYRILIFVARVNAVSITVCFGLFPIFALKLVGWNAESFTR